MINVSEQFCGQIINRSLHDAMQSNDLIHFMGEDIADPYGGAFKISKGLSTRFPERVHTTPISEAAITGIAGGMAISGLRPVVEIMFGDFLSLCFDQILNYLSKMPLMFANNITCPVVIRTPMGGYRGYGPTHSQSLEKHFLGVPGIDVVALDRYQPIEKIVGKVLLESQRPTLLIENKRMYAQRHCIIQDGRMGHFFAHTDFDTNGFPLTRMVLDPTRTPDTLVVCYGDMATLSLQAAERLLIDFEISAEVLILSRLNPLPHHLLLERLKVIRRLVTVEEGSRTLGIGAEIVANLVEHLPANTLLAAPKRVAAAEGAIPAAMDAEADVLPSIEKIVTAVLESIKQ